MTTRRPGGRETWSRLLEWDRGQPDSERLAARIFRLDRYEMVDPSHSLGGKDGGKDLICSKGGEKGVAASYFPRGQQTFTKIKGKFSSDWKEAEKHDPKFFIFFTNQELRLAEREELKGLCPVLTDIYHLERIASCLDAPSGYGLRLEFLSIEMTKEEQLSFFSDHIACLPELIKHLASLTEKQNTADTAPWPKEIPTVFVDQENPFDQILGRKLVECVSCKRIFRCQRRSFFNVFPGNPETVSCPFCNAVQAYKED